MEVGDSGRKKKMLSYREGGWIAGMAKQNGSDVIGLGVGVELAQHAKGNGVQFLAPYTYENNEI